MAHEIAHVTAHHAMQRAELERRSDVISKAALVIDNRDKSRDVSVRRAVEPRQLLAPAGIRGRRNRCPRDRQGGLRSLRRVAVPRGARTLGGDAAIAARPRGRRQARHHVDASIDAGAHRTGDRRGAPDRRAGCRRGRPRTLSGGDRGHCRSATTRPRASCAGACSCTRSSASRSRRRPTWCWRIPRRPCLASPTVGAQALRLDRVHVADGTSLESYLASGWIDGLQQSSVESLVVNGFPAATATARGSDWMFRLAAIRYGGDVYRLIFATKELSEQDRAAFRAALEELPQAVFGGDGRRQARADRRRRLPGRVTRPPPWRPA